MNVCNGDDHLGIDLDNEADTERLGQALAEEVSPGIVIGLVGNLGAGKTRLVRAIAEALEVDPAAIASPTFVLIHEYEGTIPVYHFDVYRLPSPGAFEDLGPSDYWSAGGVCLVEWADRVPDSLPPDAWWITLQAVDPTRRTARITAPPSVRERLRLLLDSSTR